MKPAFFTPLFVFLWLPLCGQYNTIQYNTIQYNTIQYNTIQGDSSKHSCAAYAIPTALAAYGALTRFSKPLQNLDHRIHARIKENVGRKYTFDDYLQYAPAAAVYAVSLTGVAKPKHSCKDQTILLANAYLLSAAAVQTLKRTTQVARPNAGARTSFPSGHTATAFVGAHLLYKEYRHSAPLIGCAGYLSAATVGAFRMVNQRHWLSDAAAGAGLGMLCAEASCLMLPMYRRLFDGSKKREQKSDDVVLLSPIITTTSCGAGLTWIF